MASPALPGVVRPAERRRRRGVGQGRRPGRLLATTGTRRSTCRRPGVDIASTWAADAIDPSPGWAYLDGTSMASPHVAGVAALLASQDPTLLEPANLATLKSRLLTSGKSLPLTVGDTVTGRMVDARYRPGWRGADRVRPEHAGPHRRERPGHVRGQCHDRLAGRDRRCVGGRAATTSSSRSTAVPGRRSSRARRCAASPARSPSIPPTSSASAPATGPATSAPYLEGASLTPKRFQETTGLATYTGSWALSSSSSWSGGKTKYATKANAAVSFTFIGRAVAVVAPKSTTRGSVRVYVDDVYVGAAQPVPVAIGEPAARVRDELDGERHAHGQVRGGRDGRAAARRHRRLGRAALAAPGRPRAVSCPGRSSSRTTRAAAARDSCA